MTKRFDQVRELRANNARLRRWKDKPHVDESCSTGGWCSHGPMDPQCEHNTTFKGR